MVWCMEFFLIALTSRAEDYDAVQSARSSRRVRFLAVRPSLSESSWQLRIIELGNAYGQVQLASFFSVLSPTKCERAISLWGSGGRSQRRNHFHWQLMPTRATSPKKLCIGAEAWEVQLSPRVLSHLVLLSSTLKTVHGYPPESPCEEQQGSQNWSSAWTFFCWT